MVNIEMKNAFNAFNASEPMNWVSSNTKQNEAARRKKEAENLKKAAERENNKARKEAVKRSQANTEKEKAARRKKEAENLKKAAEREANKARNEAVKKSQANAEKEKAARRKKEEANKARNERVRVRAQKKEEENRKKKQNEAAAAAKKKQNEAAAAAKKKAEEEAKRKAKAEVIYKKAIQNLLDIKISSKPKNQKLREGGKVFKQAALKLHPNKKGGNNEVFQKFSSYYNKFEENPYPEIKPRKQSRNFGGHPF